MDAPTVTREVELASPPEEVWEALVDDDDRAAWFGGETTLDVEPGGRGHVTDPDGSRREVRVDEVEPGRRLSFDWWGDDDEPSHVEFVVVPRPGGSRLTVTETFPLAPVAMASCARPTASSRLLDLELLLLCRIRV